MSKNDLKQKGFIGFECKYTDKFSSQRTIPNEPSVYYGDTKDKNHKNYHKLYSDNPERFSDDYYSYIRDKNFNQLFRNELLGVQLKHRFDFVITGLFCHKDDKAIETGIQFQEMLSGKDELFKVITYQDFITAMQRLDISWDKREFSMMLWARYCGTLLSEGVF